MSSDRNDGVRSGTSPVTDQAAATKDRANGSRSQPHRLDPLRNRLAIKCLA
jgi:hypothetical protein